MQRQFKLYTQADRCIIAAAREICVPVEMKTVHDMTDRTFSNAGIGFMHDHIANTGLSQCVGCCQARDGGSIEDDTWISYNSSSGIHYQ